LAHPFFDGVRRDPQLFGQVREVLLGFQAPDMREGARPPDYRPDLASRLGEVQAPTLVVVGENDIPDFRLIADVLAENLPGARKEMIPDCWHLPPNEWPEHFNAILLSFLREQSAGEHAPRGESWTSSKR
jgi:pimeloyl-ACP methyl ester carboxylesterase